MGMHEINTLPHIDILWTGGFDSSFRMVQLSKYQVNVQPYYLRDNRQSEKYELNAINVITADIEKHPETKCTILPLIIKKVIDINPDKEVSEAYLRLHKLTSIGSQYDWLSRFSKECPGIELGFEKGESNQTYRLLMENGSIKKVTRGSISYALLEKDNTSPDLYTVFGSFHFPLPLLEMTKIDQVEAFKKLGFEETMNKTWFCHKPIKNEPCGICNPCIETMNKGLTFRFSSAGIKRYKTEIKFRDYKWFRYYKKIRRRIAGY